MIVDNSAQSQPLGDFTANTQRRREFLLREQHQLQLEVVALFGSPSNPRLPHQDEARDGKLISKLLGDFDHGKMTRRQLIKSLTVIAAAAAGTPQALAENSKGFRAIAVNHVSYQVNDYAKTRDFYADLLGLKPVADTGKQCNLILGDTNTFVIPRNAPQGIVPPRIDHVAYTIENWDKNAVKAELERRGLSPQPDTDSSFHVKDPNGFDLQICGKDMKPV
jgi:catechol 2,3-dioxygenase-like lactoylglutathione lyase family enzyme